jgi:lipoprotein-releasing system ATP-binding protein
MNNAATQHAAAGTNDVMLQVQDLCKAYASNGTVTEVLNRVNLTVCTGDLLAIIGPSGAGKSTLLHILGTLDHPTGGHVLYRESDLFSRTPADLARFRNKRIGFIFQFHHLLPEFTAHENTCMPAIIAGGDVRQYREKARDLLERIGLGNRMHHKPGELSGGEQQRVAVARALIMDPELVLADEPTGNLDSHTGGEVFDLLLELNAQMRTTLIIVTHNEEFARRMPRCITLRDGAVVPHAT